LAEDLDHAVGSPGPNGTPGDGDDIPVTALVLSANKSTTDPDGPQGPLPAPTQVRHFIVREPLGGLQDGFTYYVQQVVGDTFKLSTDPAGVNIVTPVVTGRSGASTLNRAGLLLTTSNGVHDLRINLTGPAPGGVHSLLGPGGVSLRTISPPPGNGTSESSAKGGGGGLADFQKPRASTSVTANVSAHVAAQLVQAGGKVSITSTSGARTVSYADNTGGGFVHVGSSSASGSFANTNLAYVGTDKGG